MWSDMFQKIYIDQKRSIDIHQYEQCMNEWRAVIEKQAIRSTIMMYIFSGLGLWAVYEHAVFLAVVFLALAVGSSQLSLRACLDVDIVNIQSMLALLINQQANDMEADMDSEADIDG